jgi:4-amino-4-deoxy-L-arabinose transferase-like glycosyltransferase
MSIGGQSPYSRQWVWLSAVLGLSLFAIAAINIYAIPRYPAPSCDEVSYSSVATAFLDQGQFGWSVFTQGDYINRDVNLLRQGRLYTFGLIALFQIFGVSLTVARAYSLIGGLVAATLLFFVGRRFYNARIGLLAALIFSTSIITFISSHLLRPDIWLSAYNLLTLLVVYKAINSEQLRWPFYSGVLAVATFDIHGHGLVIITTTCVVLTIEVAAQRKGSGKLIALASGLILGAIVWLVFHIWPSPEAVYTQLGEVLAFTSLSNNNTTPQSAGILQNVLSIGPYLITAYWGTGQWLSILEGLLSAIGVVTALRRRTSADRILLIWIAASFLMFMIMFAQRFVNYNILWSPLLILLGVSAIEEGFRSIGEFIQRFYLAQPITVTVSMLLMIANLVGGNRLVVRSFTVNNFEAMGQTIQRLVPVGSRVISDPNWWWVLRHDRVFITDEYFLYPMPPFNPPPANIQDGISYLKPDYILIDSATSCLNQGGPGHAELLSYAKSNCTLATQLDGAWVNNPEQSTTLLGQTTSVYRCTQP